MKFTLKDYQDDAVRKVLDNLRKASRRWREEGDRHAFSLTATTGAGKTVMAAAVFEALFHGNDDYDFEADPGAVVLWFSDDPSLNEQTRFRLLEASDRLAWSDYVVVGNSFHRETFEAGKIYFLNTQKLGKKSLLVRGHESDEETAKDAGYIPGMRPDMRSHTIWDTIQNTIENPDLTLYLVLDEAHRGMGGDKPAALEARTTIVKRLINGAGAVPALPVVWGISATVERFNAAMAGAEGRGTLPSIVVDPAKVQASGLLKDTIILDCPKDAGHFDTVLVRRATDKIIASNTAWADYAIRQGDKTPVKPLLILQVPNKPEYADIGRALDTIHQQWKDLPNGAVAHVFGEHTTQTFGAYSIPYISPERVQDSSWVRVLIAKDAISTGWDCPRAEVLVSFRPARDRTHITQLIGRMVRTPLARRIPGDERLNAVVCLLPFFDRAAVDAVADLLMRGGGEADEAVIPGRRVLVNPEVVSPNPAIPQEVWDTFLSLPSQQLPQREAKPVKRLTWLAHELAADGLLKQAGKKAHAEMHKVLDAAQARYKDEIAAARASVLQVEGLSRTLDMRARKLSLDQFLEDADFAVIEDAYRRAARIISADLARTYAEHLTNKMGPHEDKEDALLEAHADVAALGLVPEIKTYLEEEAAKLSQAWLDEHRVEIKNLPDDRQDIYRQIKAMSKDPTTEPLSMPKSGLVHSSVREADGPELPLPSYMKHLLCTADGAYPAELNAWETEVLNKEMSRPDFVAWYRNPAHAVRESLGIAYQDGSNARIVRPDFIFFIRQKDKKIAADLVDPHGTQYSDALPKLKGLAYYAEIYGSAFRRLEAVAMVGDKLKVLDLKEAKVREAVINAEDAKSLYEGSLASEYS